MPGAAERPGAQAEATAAIRTQRAFIEAVLDQVREAKELVLPLAMLEAPESPWTAKRLRALAGTVDGATGFGGTEGERTLLPDAVDLLVAFEVPFLEEEERLVAAGQTLAADAVGFEIAMVAFERSFWEARYAEYRADPGRWKLRAKPQYDVCEHHRLDSDTVRRAIRDHGVTTFEDLAPVLGTDRTCPTCHAAVTRLLLHEVRRAKGAAG